MRLLSSVCLLALAVAGCAAPEAPRSAESETEIEARLAAADCGAVRAAMLDAAEARNGQTGTAGAADAALAAGRAISIAAMFIPVPGLSLATSAVTKVAQAAVRDDGAGSAEAAALYEAASARYTEKGCGPDVPYG